MKVSNYACGGKLTNTLSSTMAYFPVSLTLSILANSTLAHQSGSPPSSSAANTPLQLSQSSQWTLDTIQTIAFGVLGVFFTIGSIFVAYLQLRHMRRTSLTPISDVELATQASMVFVFQSLYRRADH